MNDLVTSSGPLVSVYIPTKNRLVLLKRAINSVFEQTYPRIELIVADDGSTDGTRELLSEMEVAGKLRVIMMPESRGACAARNEAIKIASGQFVTGLDDDDYFMPNRIQAFVDCWNRLATHDGVAGLFDSMRWPRPGMERVLFDRDSADPYDFVRGNAVGSQVFSPKACFIEAGLFDVQMPMWQDWDLWFRMAKKFGRFIGIRECSYVIDTSHSGPRISTKPEAMIRLGAKRFADKNFGGNCLAAFRLRKGFVDYEQVRLTPVEVAGLIALGYWGPVIKYSLRRALGNQRYYRLKCWVHTKMHRGTSTQGQLQP
ncbi:glycosyltransferase [Paraburkholderia pallida]|uniref:Glycosyltransferase n=1 Tax=Paraburkholderia pallida TaxID=2547399 RepID=A0A4P7CLS6_9BURK|nr:glycosyltransferase [Paraburkholderia pallida]QBQ96700.1 glycosyltransferase [Paraburkholderia pallida]